MVASPKVLCPGCHRAIVEIGTRCPACTSKQAIDRSAAAKAYDQRRGTRHQRGYDSRWTKEAAAYLIEHPLCVECLAAGRTKAAEHVDHIEPHNMDPIKFWNRVNWQPLCRSHHSAKTMRETRAKQSGRPAPQQPPTPPQASDDEFHYM